tara:strand:- start:390 stop:950 length:561 start_codon:yes stop_codon:yes gene_type:complete
MDELYFSGEDLENISDDEWVDNYINKEKEYDEFYKENIKYIFLFLIYIDSGKNVIKIKKEKLHINNNLLKKEELLDIIKNNNDNSKYKIFSLLKYNFDINIENIDDDYKEKLFFTNLKKINDIYWNKTILKFQELNSLYLLFKHNSNNNTKKKYRKKKRKNLQKKSQTKKNRLLEMSIGKDIIELN